jgi:hypothetical protein
MQFPSRKQPYLLDMLCLLDGIKDILNFCHHIGPNAATRASLIEAFQALVPEASNAHVVTVRRRRISVKLGRTLISILTASRSQSSCDNECSTRRRKINRLADKGDCLEA